MNTAQILVVIGFTLLCGLAGGVSIGMVIGYEAAVRDHNVLTPHSRD